MEIKAVLFDIDDTLYNTSLQAESARKNAIRAMIEAGLSVDEDKAFAELENIVARYGSNYDHHYDKLIEKFKVGPSPHMIAAGIIAYHTTKIAYLVPYPDTVPTLLSLRDKRIRLGIVTEGVPVKQWEKLIRLGLQHFFEVVLIEKEGKKAGRGGSVYLRAAKRMGLDSGQCMMVGDRLDTDIFGANRAGLVTVQLCKGKHCGMEPGSKSMLPDYVVSRLSGVLEVVG